MLLYGRNTLALTFAVMFTAVSVFCAAQEEEPFSFVLQSCLYLSHYVRDNYILLEPFDEAVTSSPGGVNWATWTNMAAEARYLPHQLTQGLITCGKEYAFFALEAPRWLLNHYNLTRADLTHR